MLRRRNIGFMFECDRITSEANLKMSGFVSLAGGIWEGWKTEADDIAGLKRELGMALVNRLSFWFFNIWGGMYRSAGFRSILPGSRPSRFPPEAGRNSPRSAWKKQQLMFSPPRLRSTDVR